MALTQRVLCWSPRTHRLLHSKGSTAETRSHDNGTLMPLLQAEASHLYFEPEALLTEEREESSSEEPAPVRLLGHAGSNGFTGYRTGLRNQQPLHTDYIGAEQTDDWL